jgi:predicted nucleotidyltransferase
MLGNNISSDYGDPSAEAVESFYLETREGLFFAVKGLEHPPDRWIAVLRYVPDSQNGERRKGGVSYRRLYHFAEQEQCIQETYPQYLAYDPIFQANLQSVPRSMVRRIYDPRQRFPELAQASSRSAIEDDAVAFLHLLRDEVQLPFTALGITGSLLVGLHTDQSDLDVVVFGAKNCTKVYQALRRMLDAPSCMDLRRLDSEGVKELFAERVVDTHMPFSEFTKLEKRKVNHGRFRQTAYFIRFIKEAHEAGAIYGSLRYTPLGRAVITASIADDHDAIFTPCRYPLSGVHILEGPQLPDLNEITSFRGRFCEQARAGEVVYASGTLERVENNQGAVHHRLLLGNSPEDTLESSRLRASEL